MLKKTARYLQVALLLAILVVWGCGSDGGSVSNETTVKAATVSIIPSGSGQFVIQGDNLDGVAAIELTIAYDSATLASPTVSRGNLSSGALMVANTNLPGAIRIAIVSTGAIAGSGQIASISFAAVTGTGNVSVTSVKMISNKGSIVSAASTEPTAFSTVTVQGQESTVSGQPNDGL